MSGTEDVNALKARIEELEAQNEAQNTEARNAGSSGSPPTQAAGKPGRGRGLGVLSAVMLVLACVLAPLSVTSVWASRIISDTNQYVKTVSPLASDPAVQAVITDEVTKAVLDNVNVQQVTSKTLKAIAKQPGVPAGVAAAIPGLQITLVNGINSFVHDQVAKIVASPQFAQLWDEVNRVAHTQVVRLMSGNGGIGAVTAQGDSVTLNLGPIIAEVRTQLVAQGFSLAQNIPTVNRSFVLMQSSSITKAQTAYRVLDKLGIWLPIIAVLLLVGGVLLARDRRRALLRGGLGVAGAMIVLGVALAIMRTWYVNTTPGNVLTPTAAGDVFDTLVRFLRTSLRAVGVLGLVLAFVAFLSGSSSAALSTRRGFTQGIGSLRGKTEAAGWQTGRAGTWTYAHRNALRLGVGVLGGLVLMFWNQPTAWVVVGVALVALLLLAVIEFLGRPTPSHP